MSILPMATIGVGDSVWYKLPSVAMVDTTWKGTIIDRLGEVVAIQACDAPWSGTIEIIRTPTAQCFRTLL